jgi:iron complex outermembrane recepter protein
MQPESLWWRSDSGGGGTCRERAQRLMAACAVMALPWLASIPPAGAAESPVVQLAQTDFGNLSLEELMNVPLTLSRTEETYSQVPAAAYVVTADEIRRKGATSIPDALRGVPGVEVARVDQHTWAVTARGFNDPFANKLLVMIDGRTVYTPLFSGVYWDVNDVVLEDVHHIEIIRGPGSTLWGANAVNGVINVVTKSAAQTQGTMLTAGGGIGERAFSTLRYGGEINKEAHYRVHVKYFNRDDTQTIPDLSDGEWEMFRAGFRTDWTPGTEGKEGAFAANHITFQGDIYEGEVDQYFPTVFLNPVPRAPLIKDVQRTFGGNLLGRYVHRFSEEADLQVQTYYDRSVRKIIIFDEERDTFDVDFQNRFPLGARNAIIWGMGYRVTADDTGGSQTISLSPEERTLHLFSSFVQDEITIVEDRFRLTLGSKLEHNDFTGWELQPGARALWTPATNQAVWASVTRAVRTPSRAEDDVRINAVLAPGIAAAIFGDRAIESEKLIAYEAGYRVQPTSQLSFDVATFYNVYDELRTVEFVPPPPGFAAAQRADNDMDGETYGVEIASQWRPVDWWYLRGSYSLLRMDLDRESDSNNPGSERIAGQSPKHQFSIGNGFDLPSDVEFDVNLRYVDALPALSVPSYFALDARLAWRPRPNLEFALIGQNLLDSRHPQFRPTTIRTLPVEVERAVFGKITWHF